MKFASSILLSYSKSRVFLKTLLVARLVTLSSTLWNCQSHYHVYNNTSLPSALRYVDIWNCQSHYHVYNNTFLPSALRQVDICSKPTPEAPIILYNIYAAFRDVGFRFRVRLSKVVILWASPIFPGEMWNSNYTTIHGVGLLPCFFQAETIILLALGSKLNTFSCDRIDFSFFGYHVGTFEYVLCFVIMQAYISVLHVAERGKETRKAQKKQRKKAQSLVCSSPLCFSDALGSIVGFSQYTANFMQVYIYCMSRGRHVSASLILGHLQVHRSLCSLQCQV